MALQDLTIMLPISFGLPLSLKTPNMGDIGYFTGARQDLGLKLDRVLYWTRFDAASVTTKLDLRCLAMTSSYKSMDCCWVILWRPMSSRMCRSGERKVLSVD